MWWTIALAALLAVGTCPLPAGDHRRSVCVDGQRREYQVHVPRRDGPSRPLPVVLAFHGGGRHAEDMVWLTGLNRTADAHGFLAVYPQGSGPFRGMRTWNAGSCCAHAMRDQIDDVRFVELLLDDLAQATPIDQQRIYATGFSNGAMLCHRLAAELPHRLAAIAPVAGSIATRDAPMVPGVSVIHFHGTDDLNVPYHGGVGPRSFTKNDNVSVVDSIQMWVRLNQCDLAPTVECLPTAVNDGTCVTRTAYQGGVEGAEVALITIHGGGHTWPGGKDLGWYFGRTTRNISANELMWEFFQRHSKPEGMP